MSECGGKSGCGASFKKFARKAEQGERLNVVFLGGSLTWGANASDPQRNSYRGYTMQWMLEQFPKASFNFIDAAIGGTGSELAIFRLERDVLSHKPDLVFLDFTVNDGVFHDTPEKNVAYESLLRRMIGQGVCVMQVLLAVRECLEVDTALERSIRRLTHLKLHEAYHTGLGDVYPHIRQKVAAGEVDLEKYYCFESTHPDDPGYYLFFEAVRDGLLDAIEQDVVCTLENERVFSDEYDSPVRLDVADLPELPQGWSLDKTLRIAHWFDGLASRWMDDALVFDAAKADEVTPLKVEFTGTLLGIFGEGAGDGLAFTVRVDGVEMKNGEKDSFPTCSPNPGNNLFYWRVISLDLPEGKHTAEIIPILSDSKEGQLRIGFIGSAGK